ncbi:MAG TPA: NBR1-Ig-like domain-containing protein [Anaerolineaceae bacterium]|nr:NBR1-Ig-like domain-containing protein [Anaerolineaceae bacterium]
MSRLNVLARGLFIVILLVGISACTTATPTEVPPTEAPAIVQPSDTPFPSDTPAPTEPPPTDMQVTEGTLPTETQGTLAATTPQAVTTPIVITTPGAASSVADKYQYIGQNLADRIQVRPGTPLTIVWTVKNAGTTGWTTQYTLRYFSGVKAEKDSYNFAKAVPAGGTTTLTVSIIAPTAPGDYSTWWKLTNPQLQNFGDVDFYFTVTNTPVKGTSTPTK